MLRATGHFKLVRKLLTVTLCIRLRAKSMSFLDVERLTPLHDAYAAAIGRALVVCQHLEDCSQHVMVTYAVTDKMRAGEHDPRRLKTVALGVSTLGLGASVRRLAQTDDFREWANALDVGRESRNWLVHEAADVIHAGYRVQWLVERLREFRARIATLCEADRLLSIASYEICEREPAGSYAESYASRLQEWIFQPILDGLGYMAKSES